MLPHITNLLTIESDAGNGERLATLMQGEAFRLEHICSHGRASPASSWYDQDQSEWVMLLQGKAVLQFEDGKTLHIKAGDALTIPAKCKHRVETVSLDAVWLALHFATTTQKE